MTLHVFVCLLCRIQFVVLPGGTAEDQLHAQLSIGLAHYAMTHRKEVRS